MTKKLFIISLMFCSALLLSACQSASDKISQKAGELVAEKALEQATGGKADVDINNGGVAVKTDKGSIQTGEKISLPEGFPTDVYVFEGDIKASFVNNDPKGYTVTIETNKTVAEIKSAYEKKIAEDGWKKTGVMDFGETVSIAGEKDNRTLSIMVSSGSDGKNSIVLSVSEDKQ